MAIRSFKRIVCVFSAVATGVLSVRLDAATPSVDERRSIEISVQAFAQCMTNRKNSVALDRFLRVDPLLPDAAKVGVRAATPLCLREEESIALSPLLLRAAIYETLYRRDFAGNDLPSLDALPPLNFAAEVEHHSDDQIAGYVLIRHFGDCVARKAPRDVDHLLRTDIESPAESLGFQELNDPLSDCFPSGEVHFGRQMLRGILAEGMYKLRKQINSN